MQALRDRVSPPTRTGVTNPTIGGYGMRTHQLDEEVLAKAIDAANQERSKRTRQTSKRQRCHREAMRALETRREEEELRRNLSDFEDY